MTNEHDTLTTGSERAEIAAALEWAVREVAARNGDGDHEVPRFGQLPGHTGNGLNGRYPLDATEDRAAYHQWLRQRGEPAMLGLPRRVPRTRRSRLRGATFALVVYAPDTSAEHVARAVGSVFAQTYPLWEILVVDDGVDPERAGLVAELASADRRLRTLTVGEGHEASVNAATEAARASFVGLLGAGDELAPEALASLAEATQQSPLADVLYTDEDRLDAIGERCAPIFKPAWSPDLLLGVPYLGQLTVYRTSLLVELGGLRQGFDDDATFELALRATEQAREVVHVDGVAYHRRPRPTPSPGGDGARRAVLSALAREGEPEATVEAGPLPSSRNVRRSVSSSPLVSIIIPFRDEPTLLARCLSSVRAEPGFSAFEFVLIDNGSELPETTALVERLGEEPDVRLISAPGPFNWSAINNEGVRNCSGELLLFMNNDIEARRPRWLHALVGHTLRPEVGAVGARLLYPDGSLQHGGVVVSLGGLAMHVLRGLPGDRPGYGQMATQTRDCSAVTGACMMTRRDVFESLDGFDEGLPASFNDVDYCLRLRERGLLVVYAPLAELVHHESRSRGHVEEEVASRIILERWREAIAAGDPYHSALLSKWRDWCPISTAPEEARWKTYLTTTVLTPQRSSSK